MHIIFVITKNLRRILINVIADVSSTRFRQFLCVLLIFVFLLIPVFVRLLAPIWQKKQEKLCAEELPMSTVLMNTSTGIVASVPGDSPDDYMALHDLKAKPGLRAKHSVKDECVDSFEIIPIIHHAEVGDKSVEIICLEKNIKSRNEREKLDDAKIAFKGGFYEGTMLVGEFTGMKVRNAKSLITDKLLDQGIAVVNSEPEKDVVSRSGDEYVVALTDQWYIAYDEEEWKKASEHGTASSTP